MNPNPLVALNHFTVPVGITFSLASLASTQDAQSVRSRASICGNSENLGNSSLVQVHAPLRAGLPKQDQFRKSCWGIWKSGAAKSRSLLPNAPAVTLLHRFSKVRIHRPQFPVIPTLSSGRKMFSE